jgi:hypothetical protein
MRALPKAIALVLLLSLASCTRRPPLPAIDDVLPPDYEIHSVPEKYEDSFTGVLKSSEMWTRCFDSELDWAGLIDYVGSNPALRGYRDATDKWLGPMGIGDMTTEIQTDFIRVYTSPDAPYLVILTNIALVRQAGLALNTSGDYVITCGVGLPPQ